MWFCWNDETRHQPTPRSFRIRKPLTKGLYCVAVVRDERNNGIAIYLIVKVACWITCTTWIAEYCEEELCIRIILNTLNGSDPSECCIYVEHL